MSNTRRRRPPRNGSKGWEVEERPGDGERINSKEEKKKKKREGARGNEKQKGKTSEGWGLHAWRSCQQGVALDGEMIDHCSGAGRYSNHTPVSHPQSCLPLCLSTWAHMDCRAHPVQP